MDTNSAPTLINPPTTQVESNTIVSIEDSNPLVQKAKEQKQHLAFQIQTILNTYQLEELQHLLSKRKYLNRCNIFLIYVFHLIQSGGILTTTIATGYNYLYLIWVGIGLNILASLLNIYEKNNTNIIKKISTNIEDISKGKFVQESVIEDVTADKSPNAKTPLVSAGGH